MCSDFVEILGRFGANAGHYVYKVCPEPVWQSLREMPFWPGSPDDLRDGFIHFSSDAQLAGTLKKHFSGISNLILLAVDPEMLGDALRWEVSRGGALFPHLYGALPLVAVVRAEKLDGMDERQKLNEGGYGLDGRCKGPDLNCYFWILSSLHLFFGVSAAAFRLRYLIDALRCFREGIRIRNIEWQE